MEGQTVRPLGLSTVSSEEVETESIVPFDSLEDLAASHIELLRRETSPEHESDPSFLSDVKELIARGRQGGARLESIAERRTAQSLLNYWITVLARAGEDLPDATLIPFVRFAQPTKADFATVECPYVGLNAFTEADRGRFYGRSGITRRIINRLTECSLVILVGPTGSGKTSVINAGVLPQLKNGKVAGSDKWHYFPAIAPGREPLMSLATLLAPVGTPTQIKQEADKLQDPNYLAQQLEDDKYGGQPALIVVDRFDEVFTLCKADPPRNAFIGSLLNVTKSSESSPPKHRVILVSRGDRVNYIIQREDLKDVYPKAKVQIHPLRESDLREVIKEPARKVGLKFEAGVAEQLVREIYGDPAGLPLLQFTLLKLWKEKEGDTVTWAALNKLGSCEYAVLQTAQACYEQLSAEEKETARLILLKMVRITDNLEVVGERVRRADLYQPANSGERVNAVLGRLEQANLLRITKAEMPLANGKVANSEVSPDDQFQLLHESLWRDWEEFGTWLKNLRESLVRRQRLESLAVNWALLGRKNSGLLDKYQVHEAKSWMQSSEAAELGYDPDLTALVAKSQASIDRENLRKRAWLAFTVLLLLGLIVGVFFHYRLKRKADRLELEKVKRESEDAFRVANVLKKMTSHTSADRLSALSEIDSLVREQKMQPKIGAAILSIAIKDEDKEVAGKANAIVKQVSKTNEMLARSLDNAAYGDASLAEKLDTQTPRFYIHLATRDQEGRANTIKNALEQRGYIVPPFQVGGGGAPPINQLRYCVQSETGDTTSDNILTLLKTVDANPWTSKAFTSDQVHLGTFEIWLAGQFAQNGTLVINLTDTDGNKIEDVAFEVFIASLSNPDQKSIRSTSGYVSLLPGKYNLTVKASGYQRVNQTLSIQEGKETIIRLPLRPKN